MSRRLVNFGAGPATLPLPVLERLRDELVDTRGRGMSVLEMSHRSAAWKEIQDEAEARLRRLLGAGEEFALLFLQGGASLQFSMVPMNLFRPNGSADYVVTGAWSQKAVVEARRHGTVRIAASTEAEAFRRIPRTDEIELDAGADFVHVTSNNTIFGTQWPELPQTGTAPLVVDHSSDVLSRPIDLSRYGLLYAGAQKNLGPAGVTLVVVRRDLLDRASRDLPTMLRYAVHAEKGSLYNTPPTFAIWTINEVASWIEAEGGLPAIAARNRAKAERLYARIDRDDFYRGTAEPGSRSEMNVTFRLPDEVLEKRFLAEAEAEGLVGLKGHRSVGGLRASLYNAMTEEGVETLVGFMDAFQKRLG